MFIAILQFHLMIDGSTGLKDKRRVVRSIKDRLHKDHMVAVAEVDDLETWNLATMGAGRLATGAASIFRSRCRRSS